jgi:hypothetical protein
MRIVEAKRLVNSTNGNPRFRITFDTGEVAQTKPDASCSYEVENFLRSGAEVEVTRTRAGKIRTIKEVK